MRITVTDNRFSDSELSGSMMHMKKRLYDFLHSKASKRIISGLTAAVMMFGALPIYEINDKPDGVRSRYFSASADTETTEDDDPRFSHVPEDTNNISVKIEDFVAYSENCAKYHKYHQNDVLTILGSTGDTTWFQAGFKGLGTSKYPFGGSVTLETNSSVTLNLDAPLFNYVYDDVELNGGNYINISREYDGERTDIAHDTPILAANVINRNGGASWKINLTKPSDDAGERSYDLAEFGGIIGTMDTNASAAVDIAMDTLDTDTAPAVIVGSGSLGFACGTMKSGSQLSFTLSSNRGIADITTTEGNVGGFVGTIENGAVFDYTGVNVQGTSALIKTENGYAGGIVGSNFGTVILGTSPYTVGQYIEGTSGAGGVYGYFMPNADLTAANAFDTSDLSINCQVNGNGHNGGLFGVLESTNNVSVSGTGTVKSEHYSGSAGSYGGLIGKYKSDAVTHALEIGAVTVETHKQAASVYYGGGIGIIDSSAPSYVKFDGFTVNKAYNAGALTFGGLVASADNAFVDANNITIAVDGTFKGGAMIGRTENGVLRMSGSTDISGAKSAEPVINDTVNESIYVGQLVGYRNNALIFGTGNWSLTRFSDSVNVDDIGAWGEVLRYPSVLTVDETAHTVTLAEPSVSYTTIGSKADLVISALDMQFEPTAFLKFASSHTDISSADITITNDIDLSGTGITGLTRDNDIGTEGEKCVYSGTISAGDHTVTLAIGEPYGNGITSHDKEGRGKIYRHSYNGLVGIADNAKFENVKFDGKADVSAKKDNMFIGTAAAQAKGTLGASSAETESTLVMTVDGSGKVYAGRFVGYCTGKIGDINISSSTFDGKLTGANSAGESCFGGVIGLIAHASNDELEWEFTTVTLKGEVSNTASKTQRLGGLIAEINGYGSSGDVRDLILDEIDISGLKIEGKVNNSTQGGLLGYSWLNTNVDVRSVSLSGVPHVKMTGSGYTAGLVYRATGHWKVTSLDMTGVNIIAPNTQSLGVIVNKGISFTNDQYYSNASDSAIYLEILSAGAYTLSWGASNSLPSSRSAYVFDELCAYTASSHNSIMRNGNGIISIPTSGLKMETNAQDSLSYSAQTTEGRTPNPNARYYYNLQNIDNGKTLSSDAEKLMAWGVRKYACKNLTGCFADPSFSNNTIPNGTYDMKGYSWYPVTLDSSASISGTFKLYNKEFEICEAESANVWSSLTQGSAATQHYMLHNGLFFEITGNKILTVNNVTLQGNVAKMSSGSGLLICGTAKGSSATNKATITINGLTLDGAYIHDISSNDYAPLIINNIGSHTNLNVKNVSTKDTYKSMTAASYPGLIVDGYPKAASSLIGNVGLDTSATGLNAEFEAIRLDGRTSAVDDTNGFNTELDSAYGTQRTIFTKATLMNKFQYDSGSNGKYDYKLSEDWNNGHHYSEDGGSRTYLGVTYGTEVGYKDTDTNTEYPGKERIYIEGGKYTNPIDGSDDTGTYPDFNGFLPYVATPYNKTNKTHQLKVNHGATALSGCGTYNDPYVLANGDLETVAGIINGDTKGEIILPLKSSNLEYTANELLAADWDSYGHAAYKWDDSASKFRQFTTTGETTTYSGTGFEKDTVRRYLAHAYYSLNADIEIAAGFVGLGSSVDDTNITGKYFFRGVIVGNGYNITNKSSAPLINYSNGSVVKNVNIIVNTGEAISINQPDALAFPSANAYGAVIGQVIGGDNIIDTVSVVFKNTTIELNGNKAQLIPVGGYVGVIERGGVYFRGMDTLSATDIQGLTSAVNSHVAENDKQYLYINPIIGRVINGFAVTESNAYRPYETGTRKLTGGETEQTLTNENGAVTMKNNNKHYSITDISASVEKLNNASTAITVPNGQAFFIMSLLVNSGMSNGSLGYNNDYQISRWAEYDEVGADAENTGDYATAHTDSTNNKGWLMHNYASGTQDISGAYTTTITLSENTRYVLPDGYKGIGNIFQNNDAYRMKISNFDGNGATIEQGTYYYYYDTIDYYSGGSGYRPNEALANGLGLINILAQDCSISDLTLTGSVKNDLINYSNGTFITDKSATDCQNNKYLSSGMLIGTSPNNVTISNVVINNVDVFGVNNTGGMIGFIVTASNDGVTTKKFSYDVSVLNEELKEDMTKYNSAEIRVKGRTSTGGLIGKINQGFAEVNMNGHTFNLTEVVCESTNRGNGNYYDYGVGGFIGMMRVGTKAADTNLEKSPSNFFKNIVIGTKDKEQTVKCENANIFTAGVVGIMNKCKGISIENCDFYNLSVTSKFAAGGLVAFPTTYTPARAVNVNLYSPLGSKIESTEDYAGGLIASSDPRESVNDGSQSFTFDRCLVENYNISGASGAGGIIGFRGSYGKAPLIAKNVEVRGCTIKSDNTAGGLAGEIINPLIGYNVLLNNVTLSPITPNGSITCAGHICGNIVKNKLAMTTYGSASRTNSDNTPIIKIAGLSRQGNDADMEKDVIGNCYYAGNIYGEGGYIVFADYDGKAITNPNDKFSNVTTGGNNPVERIPVGAKQITTDYEIIAKRDSGGNLTVKKVTETQISEEDSQAVTGLVEGEQQTVSSSGTRYRYIPPTGSESVTSIADLTGSRASSGFILYYGNGSGNTYFSNHTKNPVKGDKYIIEETSSGAAGIWYFEPYTVSSSVTGHGYFKIYTLNNGDKAYICLNTGAGIKLGTSSEADIFDVYNAVAGESFYLKRYNNNNWLQHSGSGGGIRYYSDNNNADNSRIKMNFADSLQEKLQKWTYNSGLDFDGTSTITLPASSSSAVDATAEQLEDFNSIISSGGFDTGDTSYEVINIRRVYKENIFEDSDNLPPYVTTSPKFNISASQFLAGDGVSSAFFDTSTYKHIIDDITAEKNKSYTYALPLTDDQKKMVADHISTSAKEYNNYSGLPNFPLLVVDDTDYTTITQMIDDYLRMLTNTRYYFETDQTGVYEVGLHKCVWTGSSFMVDTDTSSGCLKKYTYGSNNYFRMKADTVDTGAVPQFTLMDIRFLDPNDSTKVAYHLYVPVYVKKLLQFNFTASLASNTDYYNSAYKNYGNTLFENLGNPVTLKFEYQYTRTPDEWIASINSGDSVLTNYSKSLILTNQTHTWPSGTKLVLIDVANGDKRYYLDTPPSGTSLDLADFTSDKERTEHYTPVTFNDLMTVTVDSDENGHLLLTDDNGASQSRTIGNVVYPATVRGADGKYYTYVSDDEIPQDSDKYSVTSVTSTKEERYYLSIFTPKSNTDTNIYHYEISSKESFAKPDNDSTWRPNKIQNRSQVVHLFIGDLYDNNLVLEVEPRKHGVQLMGADNNFLTVTMTANIGLTKNAGDNGIGENMGNNLNTSSIYQTFVQTYDMLEDIGKDSEIGIVPEAGLHIGDRDKAYYIMAGKVNAADFIESNSNKITSPEYLYDPDKDSQIELRNNVNLIRYLSDSDNQNAVTLRVKYDLAYSASDLSYQFPKKDEGINDNIGTKVIGYSNISSSLESAAYSATSVHKEDNYDTNGDPAGIRYYTDEDTKATLDYMVVETKDEMAGPYSYLGKNASELGNALSFVDTNALYDTRNLKGSYEYIELDMELFGKWDNYTAPIAVTDYLKNIRIDGIGTNTLYDQNKTDAEQTGDTVKVDTTDPNKLRLWVRKDQLLTQAEGMYLFPISYDVLTGDASFNSDGFMYSNYKVQLTAVTCGSLGSTIYTKSSYATDHLIYTNARLEPTVIN